MIIEESKLFISVFLNYFFIIAFAIAISLFVFFFIIYYKFRYDTLKKKLKKNKHVILMDFIGNWEDLGEYKKTSLYKGDWAIFVDRPEYETYKGYVIEVADGELRKSMLEYENHYIILTDFKGSDLDKRRVKCLIHQDIIIWGFKKGIERIYEKLNPFIQKIKDLEIINKEISDRYNVTVKNAILDRYITTRKQEDSMQPFWNEMDKRIYAPSIIIAGEMKKVMDKEESLSEDIINVAKLKEEEINPFRKLEIKESSLSNLEEVKELEIAKKEAKTKENNKKSKKDKKNHKDN